MSNKREVNFIEGVFDLSDDHVQVTEQFYDQMTTYYLRNFEFSNSILVRTKEDYIRRFLELLPNDTNKRDVLVLGSGGGRDAMWIAQNKFFLELVDTSAEMLEMAKRFVAKGLFINMNMMDYLVEAKNDNKKYVGILNESAGQHVNKDKILQLLDLARDLLVENGVLVLGLKIAPEHYKDVGPVYSVTESGMTRYFVSWCENEIAELKEYAESIGLNLVDSIEVEHLEKSHGTPNFIRLFFSPRV